MKNTVGFVCFGEVNTPIERLNMKHDEALAALREKVENVVNPPHTPTVRNNTQALFACELLLKIPHSRPIRRHPTRFTRSVPHGNPLLMPFIATEIRYLAAPPMKLPAPTIIIFLMISDAILLCISHANME